MPLLGLRLAPFLLTALLAMNAAALLHVDPSIHLGLLALGIVALAGGVRLLLRARRDA